MILNRKFDELKKIPTIKSERLVMKKIKKCDTKNYGKLNLDDELNRWWGYDYRGDLNGVKPTKNYFYKVQKEDFKNKTHICFGVYLKEKFIGEVVMQNFDFKGNAEIGMRIFKKYSGKGYAHEALKAVMKTMINKLSLEGIWAKCYKENIASKKALLKSGMSQSGSDERFFYFNR